MHDCKWSLVLGTWCLRGIHTHTQTDRERVEERDRDRASEEGERGRERESWSSSCPVHHPSTWNVGGRNLEPGVRGALWLSSGRKEETSNRSTAGSWFNSTTGNSGSSYLLILLVPERITLDELTHHKEGVCVCVCGGGTFGAFCAFILLDLWGSRWPGRPCWVPGGTSDDSWWNL